MKLIAIALILILLAPLNVVTASAMQIESGLDGSAGPLVAMVHMGSHHHAAMPVDSQLKAMMDSHDHNAEDCDEYCKSCSNHCSNIAIISGSPVAFDPGRRFSYTRGADLECRAYLLFRPPIVA